KEKTKHMSKEMEKMQETKSKALHKYYLDKYPKEVQIAITKKPEERTPLEWHFYYKAMLYMDPASHQFLADADNTAKALKGDAKKRFDELKAELDQFKDLYPGDLPVGTGLVDVGRECPPTYVLRKGVFDAPTQEFE